MIIGCVVIAEAIAFFFTPLPDIKEVLKMRKIKPANEDAFQSPLFILAVAAQYLYCSPNKVKFIFH
jgi:fucose permease